jgi:hypothetical protein
MFQCFCVSGFQVVGDFMYNSEQNLVRGCQRYESALDIFSKMEGEDASRRANIIKRYGNVRNELGVHYMNQAAALAQEAGENIINQFLSLCLIMV